MKRSIIKLKFISPIHIGDGSLNDNEFEIKADTIFSALCIESGNIPEVIKEVRERGLKISDAFPYIDKDFYIPKPMIQIQQESEDYKLFKKIKYIPEDILDQYIQGTIDPKLELENFDLGEKNLVTRVSVGSDPYEVGTYSFKENTGLYIIVEHTTDYIFELFEKLQYSGIGGKRTSGLGRFTFTIEEAFNFPKGNKKILLNTAMANKGELKEILNNSNYLLQKRSGFIHGSRYKKQDLYTFKSGSVFEKSFAGNIFDVGSGEHPVYRYAIPMFLEVNI